VTSRLNQLRELEEARTWLSKGHRSRDEATRKAQELSRQAQEALSVLGSLLTYALEPQNRIAVKWRRPVRKSTFSRQEPQRDQALTLPVYPEATDAKYELWFDRMMPKPKDKQEFILARCQADRERWPWRLEEVKHHNATIEERYQRNLKRWESAKRRFQEGQHEQAEHDRIAKEHRKSYLRKLPESVVAYCDTVLKLSQYPDYFPKEFDLDYIQQTGVLIVDYSLCSVDVVPRLKEVKYIRSKNDFVGVFLSEAAVNKVYDDLVYQVVLRIMHELYQADQANALDSIALNAWVKSINKATGTTVNSCIASVHVKKQEFASIVLSNVDPKACFKLLKGVGSSKLHGLIPIAPILSISREDTRFVASYAVADYLDESVNLAAMDWEDFEHLIREVFEKEFSQYNGEVKITQTSRDRGVDAIAFDPDPIRGGKIVIQAKRYTNTVGVAAVRDLYGTVINEGATKGILITTADYGPDAHDFAKGKPLTLLNGANLLHLLEKHGQRAKIDLQAARAILAEKESN
jgi:restriction system protein